MNRTPGEDADVGCLLPRKRVNTVKNMATARGMTSPPAHSCDTEGGRREGGMGGVRGGGVFTRPTDKQQHSVTTTTADVRTDRQEGEKKKKLRLRGAKEKRLKTSGRRNNVHVVS